MSVYIELVIFNNLAIDLMLICAVQTTRRRKAYKLRIALATLLGAVCATIYAVAPKWASIVIKILLAPLMALIFDKYGGENKRTVVVRKRVFSVWFKVIVACVPGAIVTLLFDDFIEAHLHTPFVIAAALIVYGIAFIVVEKHNRTRKPSIRKLSEIDYKTALLIGLFQVLSIIPGTSRSGATIIGALIIGVSRTAGAQFTFFLAVPVMFGLSFIKLLKFGLAFTGTELAILLVGSVSAFLVSLLVIKFLMNYIKKHDFTVFGWYRIALGIVVMLYFAFAG